MDWIITSDSGCRLLQLARAAHDRPPRHWTLGMKRGCVRSASTPASQRRAAPRIFSPQDTEAETDRETVHMPFGGPPSAAALLRLTVGASAMSARSPSRSEMSTPEGGWSD